HSRHLQTAPRFARDVLAIRIDDEQRGRQPLHLPDAREVAVEVFELVVEALRVLLRHGGEVAALLALVEIVQAVDALLDRDEVREEAAEPTLVDVWHRRALRLFSDRLLRLLLRADEQDLAAAGREVAHKRVGVLDAREGLLEVDDVDAVA